MKHFNLVRICSMLLLAGFVTTQAHAIGFSVGNSSSRGKDNYTTNRPWGNLGPSKPAPKYQAPQPQPQPGNYYMGAAPGTGWYPANMPAGNSSVTSTTPEIEVAVSDTNIYERQNIIVTARVISDGNLAVLDDKLPRIDGAVMDLIDGPVTTTLGTGSYNRAAKIVNTYHYRVTPLRAGEIVIPAIQFDGQFAANNYINTPRGAEFSAAAATPLTLQVQPADPAVQPWLPVHDLILHTKMQPEGRLKAGQPVTLTLELTARGAMGNQLPSLAGQLNSPQYRVYRDDTKTTGGVSTNGRYLTGSRMETYTIIPLEDGWIHLPNIGVAWWDVDTHQARLAGNPPSQTEANAANAPASAGSAGQSLFPIYGWVPMAIALALIAGYLLGAWPRTRPLLRQAGAWCIAAGRSTARICVLAGSRLSMTRQFRQLRVNLGRLRMNLALVMPKSVRIWMCTRCLATEEDPRAWCDEFRDRVCRHLDISGHAPLTSIAERIIATSPRTAPDRLRELAHSMDGAIYGGKPLDFRTWKQDLQQQLRPHLLRRRSVRSRLAGNRLPVLNPRVA